MEPRAHLEACPHAHIATIAAPTATFVSARPAAGKPGAPGAVPWGTSGEPDAAPQGGSQAALRGVALEAARLSGSGTPALSEPSSCRMSDTISVKFFAALALFFFPTVVWSYGSPAKFLADAADASSASLSARPENLEARSASVLIRLFPMARNSAAQRRVSSFAAFHTETSSTMPSGLVASYSSLDRFFGRPNHTALVPAFLDARVDAMIPKYAFARVSRSHLYSSCSRAFLARSVSALMSESALSCALFLTPRSAISATMSEAATDPTTVKTVAPHDCHQLCSACWRST